MRVKNLSVTPCISFCQAAATLCQAPEAQRTGRCPSSARAALGERAAALMALLPAPETEAMQQGGDVLSIHDDLTRLRFSVFTKSQLL